MKKETSFQSDLIKHLNEKYHDIGVMVLKNDANYLQGVPDLIVLVKNKWAMLEVKRSYPFHIQPNQKYYVEKLDRMSFAAFIYPENKDFILTELDDFIHDRPFDPRWPR